MCDMMSYTCYNSKNMFVYEVGKLHASGVKFLKMVWYVACLHSEGSWSNMPEMLYNK